MKQLKVINDDTNSELVSVVLLEAKAVHPTDEKMVPHINALYHQCTDYWLALLNKVDGGGQRGQGPVGRMLRAAIPIFIGANFGKAPNDLASKQYDESRQREVETAFAFWNEEA